jgi:hypothetical protein
MDQDERLAEFERSLGLSEGFVRGLGKEGDDWTFVIKAHALIETGLTELLIHSLGHPELENTVVKLPISGQFSKLTLCREMGMLPDNGETERFVKELGTVRNYLVHNIRRVDFSLADYFRDLRARKRDEFLKQYKALDLFFADLEFVEYGDKKVPPEDVFSEDPRFIIRHGLELLVLRIQLSLRTAKVGRDIRDTADKLLREVMLAGLAQPAASSAALPGPAVVADTLAAEDSHAVSAAAATPASGPAPDTPRGHDGPPGAAGPSATSGRPIEP